MRITSTPRLPHINAGGAETALEGLQKGLEQSQQQSGKGKGGEPEAAEESDEPMEAPTQEEVAAFKELQSAFTKGDPTAGAPQTSRSRWR